MNSKMFSSSNVFETNYPTAWKQLPKCTICFGEFSFIDRNKKPLILKCAHSVCEGCVSNKRLTTIICRQCQNITNIDRKETIRKQFEFNYYILGILNYVVYNVHKNRDYSISGRPKNISNYRSGQHECSECNLEYTKYFCVQCSVPYCKICFDNVHKFGKALKKHCLTLFDRHNKSILDITQEQRKCSQHRRFFVQYCISCDETGCNECISEDHKNHKVRSILAENQSQMPKLYSLIETLKMAIDYNKQAQKDVRFVEKKYEDYATETIESVSKHFIHLHGILQNLENEILIEIKNKTTLLLKKTDVAQETLKTSCASLEEVISALNKASVTIPINTTVSNIIERTNRTLETTPCNIQFDGVEDNPFEFTPLTIDFKDSFRLDYSPNLLSTKFLTFFGDLSISDMMETTDKNLTIVSKKQQRNQSKVNETIIRNDVSLMNAITRSKKMKQNDTKSSMPHLQKRIKNEKVHVSHIKNAQHFYVQTNDYISNENEFKTLCTEEADYSSIPNDIELDGKYLILHAGVAFRCNVIAAVRPDVYRVYLIDYGDCLDIPKQRFREISDVLRSRPYKATKCSIYGIKSQTDKWTDESKQLMSEIIQNELVNMMVVHNEDDTLLVDLMTTHHKFPTSLRDALLYKGFAVVDESFEKEHELNICAVNQIKKNTFVKSTPRFYKNVFKEGESFRCKVLHIVTPHEFYAMKHDHKDVYDVLYEKLNISYLESKEKIFVPQPNMPCAVCISGEWYRARISEVFEKEICSVWLIDHGRYENVAYENIRVLEDEFMTNNELVFQCSLIDIEPLPQNDYMWTEKSISEFKRITQNPILQLFIHHSKEFRYQVGLYVLKRNMDISINSVMVKYKHAISTGNESACVEYPKNRTPEKNDQIIGDFINNMNLSTTKSTTKSITKSNQRAKVKICHIITPGEFYLTLCSQNLGIEKLHEVIQSSQENKFNINKIKKIWEINEHCLVKVSLKKNNTPEWYRGIIIDCYEEEYTVFLRDHGKTLLNISSEKITEIDDLYDRVCNAAIKCCMSCVQPTGGLTKWSASAIDEFNKLIEKFEAFAVSIQGERKNDSMSVILWGMTTERSNPLSSNSKWCNINKSLVNCGLAHLTGKFDIDLEESMTIDKFIDGEETFSEWVKNFQKVIDTIKQNETEKIDELITNEHDYDFDEEIKEPFLNWLPPQPLTKTIFTAIPTYVDENCIIYLHDTQQESLLERLKSFINFKLANTKDIEREQYWYAGQPCLARYHLDNDFYRAIVLNTKAKQNISVQFIDYGNIEDCLTNELRKEVLLTNIPIQAHKFKLHGVLPLDDKWTTNTLDIIHGSIVGKLCTIRIIDYDKITDIQSCSIQCETFDLAEYLKSNNLVKNCNQDYYIMNSKFKNDIVMSPRKCLSDFGDDDILSDIILDRNSNDSIKEDNKNMQMDSEEYRKMFEQKEIEKLYNSKLDCLEDNSNSDTDIVEVECTFQSGYWQSKTKIDESDIKYKKVDLIDDDDDDADDDGDDEDDINTTSSITSFNPKVVSSLKSHASRFRSMQLFQKLSLIDIDEFYCELTFIKNPTHLYLYPFLTDHQKQFKEMSQKIQMSIKNCENFTNFELNTPCLGLYETDGQWYRAIIRSYDSYRDEINIVFVDFLNSEIVKPKMIKKCPQSILDIPLRNIEVKLSDIKPNRRYRTADIERRLYESLTNKKIFVKIVELRKIPEVILFDSHKQQNILYKQLIEDRFYLRSSE